MVYTTPDIRGRRGHNCIIHEYSWQGVTADINIKILSYADADVRRAGVRQLNCRTPAHEPGISPGREIWLVSH